MEFNGTRLTASRRNSVKSQQTNASTPAQDVQNARPALRQHPSVRLRPPTATQNADPPSSPWASSVHTERLRRPSKMSLFNMFKSPKVERLHGYVEPDLPTAITKEMNGPTSPVLVQVTSANNISRPVSVASAKATNMASTSSNLPPPQLPYAGKLRKQGPFEHPPLFQAYPQAMKEGTLEVSSIPVEALNKARHQLNEAVSASPGKGQGERNGMDPRRASALQPSPNALLVAQGLPKKFFVLVTSGYLLQYAETGTSDRLPEKVLSLGKDSAVFACDAVAGKHHVLQVSQAVDHDGIIISSPGSLFTRLGMRGAAAKRMTSNFVLVLPNASEMDSWLTAIRQEIEVIRGAKRRAETTRAPVPFGSLSTSALDRTPSHRYQVKRDPKKVTPASSPGHDQLTFISASTHVRRKSDALTLENIEMEASRLDAEPIELKVNTLLIDDQPLPPTPPASVDPGIDTHQQGSDAAARFTPAEQPRVLPFRHSGIFASQRPGSARDSLEAKANVLQDDDTSVDVSNLTKPGFSSHNFSRKAPPAPLSLQSKALAPAPRPSPVDQLGIVSNQPAIPERHSPSAPLTQDRPNSQFTANNQSKHDSKIVVSSAAEKEDLASEDADEVGMLPVPSSMASARLSIPNVSVTSTTSASGVRSSGSRRVASFSMPLKVNPANTSALLPSGNPRRHSRMDEPERREHVPVGLAITPPVTIANSISYFDRSNSSRPASEGRGMSSPSSTPNRLSLFPISTPIFTTDHPIESPKCTSSVATRQTSSQSTYPGALKRPASMQVRSDRAPFLASVRLATGYTDVTNVGAAAPIRAMKPSRPTSSFEAFPQRHSSLYALQALKFDTPTVQEESATVTSLSELPAVDLSPPAPPELSKVGSRLSVRRSRHKSPLPNLDFGIPVVGLGPPAPPPQMPLPAPPTTLSRAASPAAIHSRHASIEHVAGLGISVS